VTRIVIFLPSLSGGGAERVLLQVANEITSRGYEVDLVLSSVTGPYISEVINSINIVDLGASRVLFSLFPLWLYIKRSTPKIILSALSHANLVAIISVMFSKFKPRVVISERNIITQESINNQGMKGSILRYLMHKFYHRADSAITVSNGVSDSLIQYTKLLNKDIFVVPNPCDIDRISLLSNKPIDDNWFFSSKLPVVIGIGRLTRQKDFHLLIKAFSIVLKENNARLLILGEGELRSELESLALSLGLNEKNFFMPGFVSNPFNYLKNSNVFVLSSRWEGFPNVLLHALGCGCPIVATDCRSGPVEILENGKWGYLTPVGDVEAMAKSITLSLEGKNKHDLESRCLFFDIETTVNKYIKVIFR